MIDFQHGKFERPVPTHSHANHCYEIHLISSGYGLLLTEEGEYDLNPGSLFVTGPNVKHEQQPLFPDSMAEYCIYIEVKKKKETSGEMMDILISHPFLFTKDDGKILKLVRELFDELIHKYIGYEQQAGALFSMILVHMMRCFMQCHGLQKQC